MTAGNTVPRQQEGKQADIIAIKKVPDVQEAKLVFLQARERLLNISAWGQISEGISASFLLTDHYGNAKEELPAAGDHIRIDIPGPGSAAGAGYDWVKIELVEDKRSESRDEEWSVIRVRPSEDPVKKEGVAHFFEDQATSSFIVRRINNDITAEVHGRNEKPNTESKKITDKIRNAVVGTAAATGVAKIQWQNLAKGILNIR